MRILYICHRFPFPPRRGGKIRPFNMIRHLAKNHDVTVASLARSDEEAADLVVALMRAGVRVVSLAPSGGDLEAAYLELTEERR